jgi:hypothetical protein
MKLSYSLTNIPLNGATITPAVLHGMVDHLTFGSLGATEIISGGDGIHIGDTPATSPDAFVQIIDKELYSRPNTNVSLTSWPVRTGMGKSFLAFWTNVGAPNTYAPTKGMPCWTADGGLHHCADFSLITGFSLTSLWALPKVVMSQKQWGRWWDWYNVTNTFYPAGYNKGTLWFLMDETISMDKGIVKCLDYGWGTAMVHATLSNSLVPGAIYGIRYNVTDQNWFPVSWDHTNPSEATLTVLPLGIVRRVHLTSGVTAVPYIIEQATSMTMVSYYVADVFFGGVRVL